jgi:hypothetical protein
VFGGGVVEVAGPMRVLAPHKAEDQPARVQVIDCPWLNVIQLDQFEPANAEFTRQRSEDA